ncbi:hypothetical protein FPZ54_13800 [Sphingomonas suaedae]|uniref:DoxX family membrane protein n=1 Tax=Sphingomonas suaedae TaxID=2599297 RepID=A0A518RHP7_9SPHN|nr:hypothetical protein [Sphingomonas suaedae]QDX26970.1 hypothetical protein FPZ54_13800 [Sphingomonas suaedae]
MNDSGALKAGSLLALRSGTGSLLVLWGALRLVAPATGPGLADKYYSGILNIQTFQVAFGAAEVLLGLLVVLGLFRRITYLLQALILVPGALIIWRYLLDPMGLWLMSREDSQILFFPSIAVAAAAIVLIAFREDDRWSLDRGIGRSGAAR